MKDLKQTLLNKYSRVLKCVSTKGPGIPVAPEAPPPSKRTGPRKLAALLSLIF